MAEATFSLDLHVLGTPPAFVLSQDQTLQKYPKTASQPLSSGFVKHLHSMGLYDLCFPVVKEQLRRASPTPEFSFAVSFDVGRILGAFACRVKSFFRTLRSFFQPPHGRRPVPRLSFPSQLFNPTASFAVGETSFYSPSPLLSTFFRMLVSVFLKRGRRGPRPTAMGRSAL